MIVIIDYDIGNIEAVANMFRRLGFEAVISNKVEQIENAERLVLPGNGSYDACVRGFRATGLLPIVEKRVLTDKIPLLGICVGAQMLGTRSEEGVEPGLGWLDMEVKRFPSKEGLRIPHMGWNQVKAMQPEHYLASSLENESRFYFVHSYYLDPASREDVLFSAQYGLEFAAAVASQNIVGVQFHPEKSHRFGKNLLNSFGRGG